MRLILLTTFVMIAFAANSLLTRAGALAGADPLSFAFWRVVSGAFVLLLLSSRSQKALGHALVDWRARGFAGAALALYLLGFTFSATWVEAGVGALILFGTVQIALFGIAVAVGETVPMRKWVGMIVAMVGLAWLLWPTAGGTAGIAAPIGAALMVAAGIGWAGYTWAGRGTAMPLQASAGNFALVAVVAIAMIPLGLPLALPVDAIWLALMSGAVTSGLGYALWFKVLPSLSTTTAGVAQLSVPVIAVLAGAVLLGEALTVKTVTASVIVLSGIAFATVTRRVVT